MSDELNRYDVCVVGGGLVGLAVARALVDSHKGLSVLVLEKEPKVAGHQSSHNSGVVHSGLYYRPGSLKAKLCVEGRRDLYQMCADHGVGYDISGKLVIATQQSEIPALDELERRGRANDLTGLKRLKPEQIADYEPAATGIDALLVPEAGVADFPALARLHVSYLKDCGARIETEVEVTGIDHRVDGVQVRTSHRRFTATTLVNCAGLFSDRVARMAGLVPQVRIVPFRGEYYRLSDSSADFVRALIYPVPDPRFPFLGVHFTRRHDGVVEVGPNAVLAVGREHYRGAKPDWAEFWSILGHAGFRRLAARHWLAGTKELINSRSKTLYARQARRLLPGLRRRHLLTGGAGVRAQSMDKWGNLVDDFVIEEAGSTVHVLNAPSPGATASLAIGRHVAAKVSPLLSR